MNSKHKKITYEQVYEDLPILTDKAKKQGAYTDILKKIKDNFDDMTANHAKVLFARYDVRFPTDRPLYENDNKTFRDFQANLVKNLDRKGLDPHYVWAMERSREKHQHYHGILLLNGNKTKSIHNHILKAEELWANALNLPVEQAKGLIDDCTTARDRSKQKNGIMLRKDDPAYDTQVSKCFEWASYLAKTNTKSNLPKGARTFGSSTISLIKTHNSNTKEKSL